MSDEEQARLTREISELTAERDALAAIPEPLIATDPEGQSAWKLLRVEQSLKAKQARLRALQTAQEQTPQT